MQIVLEHIEERRREFAELPFFSFLRDGGIPPEERLAFAPAGAPFIMAFADLNKHVLHVAESTDPLQRLINVHSREDETHFQMYLRDLETLGFDRPLRFTDALRFLWSDDRKASRHTCYALTALLDAAPVRLRLVIVEAIEAMGSVAFRTFTRVAADYRAATGRGLEYFGRRHEELEAGHTIGTVEDQLHAIVFCEEERKRARVLVESVFEAFAAMMAELHAYAGG
jgi:hypothetical protein